MRSVEDKLSDVRLLPLTQLISLKRGPLPCTVLRSNHVELCCKVLPSTELVEPEIGG